MQIIWNSKKLKSLYNNTFFKAIEEISHNITIAVIKKLFSLFGQEIKNYIIFIFSFADDLYID